MESKKLTALIKKIAGNSGTLRDDIQSALIGCAFHAQVHGNVTAFNQLFQAVGKGTRIAGMSMWAATYAPVHFKDGTALLSKNRRDEFDGTPEEFEADLADSAKWYDTVEAETPANPWDSSMFLKKLDVYLVQQIKKAEKNDGNVAEILKNLEMALRIQTTKLEEVSVLAEVE
jgi:hypothetical protein